MRKGYRLPMRMLIRSLAPTALGCILLVTPALGGCDWSSPEEKKAKHRERATSYFEKNQFHEALIEYRNVAQIDPKDADAHYRLALTYLKLGGLTNLQQAFAEINKTVELDKTDQDAQLKLGEIYLLGNEPVKAREQAEIVLVSAPQNPEGLLLRGRSLINEKRYQEGIAELKKAIELDPKTMQPYIDLARAYFATNDRAAAEATLKQALSVDPRSLEIMLALADLRDATDKPDQAEIIYKQALEIAPENELIYLRLTSHYQRHNKAGDAEATLQKLASIKPKDETPHLHLGDFFTSTGQADKALASYRQANEINPSSTTARDKLITHYLDTAKTTEAEAKIKDILDKNDKDLMGRFFNARIQLAKKKPDEAISLLQGVLKDEPQFAGAHYFLGLAFLQKEIMGRHAVH